MTFVNHGCNSTENIHPIFDTEIDDRRLFDPSKDRHIPHLGHHFIISKHSVKTGQELFGNYYLYVTDEANKGTEIKEIEAMCKGQLLGQIRQVEMSKWEND